MLYRGIKLSVVGTGMVLAASAFAEGQGPKIGFEYRAGITYDDGNLMKMKGADAETSTDIAVEYADVLFEGEAAKNVMYRFDYDVLGSTLAVGALDLKLNDMASAFIGRDMPTQGGWHYKDACKSYANTANGVGCAYSNVAPLDVATDMIGINLALAGNLKIAVSNDVRNDAVAGKDLNNDKDYTDENEVAPVAATEGKEGYKNTGMKSQALAVEWVGNFGGWMPLVQLVNYDLGKSLAISAGVKGNVAGLGLMLNYTSDSRKNFANPAKSVTNVHTQIDVAASYALAGFTPWLGFHQYDVKQGGKNAKYNSKAGMWDDNGQTISVGVKCNAMGDGYVPYLTVNNTSGKFEGSSLGDTKGKSKSASGLSVKAGVIGKF